MTAPVVTLSVILAILIAVPAGLFAAWRQNKRSDIVTMFVVILGLSVPSFWVAILLILVFGVELGWLPTIGYVSVVENFSEGIRFLVLPVTALLLHEMATLTRMMRPL